MRDKWEDKENEIQVNTYHEKYAPIYYQITQVKHWRSLAFSRGHNDKVMQHIYQAPVLFSYN